MSKYWVTSIWKPVEPSTGKKCKACVECDSIDIAHRIMNGMMRDPLEHYIHLHKTEPKHISRYLWRDKKAESCTAWLR